MVWKKGTLKITIKLKTKIRMRRRNKNKNTHRHDKRIILRKNQRFYITRNMLATSQKREKIIHRIIKVIVGIIRKIKLIQGHKISWIRIQESKIQIIENENPLHATIVGKRLFLTLFLLYYRSGKRKQQLLKVESGQRNLIPPEYNLETNRHSRHSYVREKFI